MTTSRIDAAALMEHREFVSRVARRLLTADEAEDVVQDTWLATLESPPPRQAPLKAWLARVARNLSVQRIRERARRKRLETRAVRASATAPAGDLADRIAWQQRVVAAVLDLEEPYREAILLRFFENLPPRAVARRVGAPINTVRTRVRRGLALLALDGVRQRVDGRL